MVYNCELKLKDENNVEKLNFKTIDTLINVDINIMDKMNSGAEVIPPLTTKFIYISSTNSNNKYTLNNAIEFSGIIIDGANSNVDIKTNGEFDTKGLLAI